MSDPKIINVCRTISYGKASYYVVTDVPVKFTYSRRGRIFVGQHGDFFDFLQGTEAKGDAFAGREFDIDLSDGGKFHCRGDVWSIAAPKDIAPELAYVGVKDINGLRNCYVYFSGYVRKYVLEEWLAKNEPREYWDFEKECRQRVTLASAGSET